MKRKKITTAVGVTPPVINSQTLAKLLRDSKRPLTAADLLRALGLHRRRHALIEEMLEALVAGGKIIKLGRAYAPMESVHLITGRVQVQRSGVAFLIPDDPRRKDVFLGQDTGGAWHGDRVAVAITRESSSRGRNHEGRVARIIERGKKVLPVRVVRSEGGGRFLCRPSDPRLDFAVLARGTAAKDGLGAGDIALVTPGERVDSAVWEGTLLSRLGPEGDAKVQEALVKADHDVPTRFPKDVRAEAVALPSVPDPADFRNRKDLRDMPFVTIDGPTARDFDDAVCVEESGRGFALWVAIADVSHYVAQGSALDREAYARGNSYYFPASVEPMLPTELSNGLCSLNPNEPRLAVAVRMEMDAEGRRGEAHVMNAVIRSHARLTYDRARDVCVDRLPAARTELAGEAGPGVVEMLDRADALAQGMRARRLERGSLDFDLPEGDVVFDAAGRPVAIAPRERHFAHKIIEEFMIAANEAVSEYLQACALPCLFRVHAAPDREKLEALYVLLDRLAGPAAPKHGRAGKFTDADFTPEAVAGLLRSVAGTDHEFLVNRLVLRSMQQARYQPDNEGHFGLASESYAHFTSPIRRYADLVVHRLVKRALGDEGVPVPAYKRLAEIGRHLSACERVSQESERECQKRYACLVLRDQIGREYDGVVSSLTDFGFWVEMPEALADGFIRLSTMLDDYYAYVKEREMLVGSRTGRVIRMGQPLRVRLVNVSLDRLEINLELAETSGTARAASDSDAPDARRRPAKSPRRPRGNRGHAAPRRGKSTGSAHRSAAHRSDSGKRRRPSRKRGGKTEG